MCVPGRRGRCEAIDEVGSNFGSSDANGRVNFSTSRLISTHLDSSRLISTDIDTFTSFIHLHTPSSSSSHTPMISHFIFITKTTFTSHLHSSPHLTVHTFHTFHIRVHLISRSISPVRPKCEKMPCPSQRKGSGRDFLWDLWNQNFPCKVTSSTSPCFLVTSKFDWFAQSQ